MPFSTFKEKLAGAASKTEATFGPTVTKYGPGFARRAAQFSAIAEGGARRASLQSGTNYSPGRGYTTVPVPIRSQSQAAVWGTTGQIGATAYSGFGQLELDRGFRGVNHVLGQEKMRGDDVDEVPLRRQLRNIKDAALAKPVNGVTQRTAPPNPYGSGPVIDTTATTGPTVRQPQAWTMGPAGYRSH